MLIKNKVGQNILALSLIKGLQYILAFITFPYLVRVLQVEKFGAIAMAQGIIQYFMLFTDYGFNLTGPRDIAKNDTVEKRSAVFSSIFFAKILLLLLASLVFILLSVLVSKSYKVDILLYFVVYLSVIGNVMFPVWFFQGIQEMRYITIANIIARAAGVCGIFIFVKTPDDYVQAALMQSMVPVLAAVYSWYIIVKKYPELLCRPGCGAIYEQLKNGWAIFVSTIAINLYTASNVVFLGILTNNTVVGYYSGAKKIVDNITAIFSPVSEAIYPHVSKLADDSKEKAILFLKKLFRIVGVSAFVLSTTIFVFAEAIVGILLGNNYGESVFLLRILAFLPLIIALSNLFGIQTMLTLGMQKTFSGILVKAAVFNTIIVLPLIYLYQSVGVCVAILITEFIVTTVMCFALKRNNIQLF
ncbi:MAG: flippase [Negativicutes bacterium]|nr:flippase [Negativicutes bacterium]